MAVLLEWVDGEARYIPLKQATSPGTLPPGITGPVYEVASDQSEEDEITLVLPPPPKLLRKNERRLKSNLASLTGRKRVYLPPEVIHRILQWTQPLLVVKGSKSFRTLKDATLVAREWVDPARRIMFEKVRIVNAPGSIARLRSIFDRSPELGRAVQTLDLSKPADNRNDHKLTEIMRRSAGLIRSTPCVIDVSFVHVALSFNIRSRFFSALSTLRPTTASITSASHGGHRQRRAMTAGTFESRDDVLALGRLLCGWTSLETLTLTGYSDSPRILSSTIFSQDMSPSYQLTSLSLDGLNLAGSTLSQLVGPNCATSLKTLELSDVTELENETLKRVLDSIGSSLIQLRITMQSDDGDVDDFFEPSIFAQLGKLESLTIDSDYFEDALLDTVISLPSIETIHLHLNSFSFPIASAALDKASGTLEQVCLTDGSQPDHFWPLEERWELGKRCSAKGFDLMLNGWDFDDVEDDWWGIDLRGNWKILERSVKRLQRRGRG